jgi:filamentous hemagglutinin
MNAGSTLHVTGSDIVAAGNVSGTGADVIIDAAQNTTHHDETHETHETHSSGFTLAVKSSVIDAIQTAGQQARAADSGSGDSRTDTLHALASAGSVINGATPLASGQAPDWKVELSFGSSSSKSTSSDDSVANRGSSVMAGGTSSFIAKGDGTADSGNVTIAGSDINAKNVVLAANNQVNLVNSTDTDSNRSESNSSSSSIGVSVGTSGIGASVSGSNCIASVGCK